MQYSTKNLIIGAGPAGLAAAGRLRAAGEDFIVLEQSYQIAHRWHNHYERLKLHTVKRYSALPLLPFPDDYPQYVPRTLLVDYYENYATHFSVKPHFKQKVILIEKEKSGWKTQTEAEAVYQSENVIICTGFNRIPYRPHWRGMENFRGKILHSREYRTGKNFRGQNVLVIGMGNTGAEIALDLYEQGANAFLSVRGEVNIVPRDFNGKSIQETVEMLRPLPVLIRDFLGKIVRKIAVGDLRKYGIRTPNIAPAKQLRVYGKTPVIDLGTVAEIKNGNIGVLPDVEQFTETGLLFTNKKSHNFDTVILATGYRAAIEDFLPHHPDVFNELGIPKQPVFPDGLHFLGYDAYSSGLLYSIARNSETVVNSILQNEKR